MGCRNYVIESMQVKRRQMKILLQLQLGNQSTIKRPFFKDFEVVIGDEAHLFKSKSLISIMTKMDAAKYRLGLLEL